MPSTVILSARYDPETLILRVTFLSGMVYLYKDVPPEVYEEMMKARSKGKFLNQEIKGNYEYEKLKSNIS